MNPMNVSNDSINTNDTAANDAAKEATEDAVKQAREVSSQVVTAVSGLDRLRLIYLTAMAVVVVSTLVFNMASFSVGLDGPVSETVADAQRVAQAKLNSWSYSAFTSSMWGKLMWLSAVAGVGVLIYEAVAKASAGWIPLAQIGCAALSAVLLLLVFVTGFPDLSAYSDAKTSATLLGYWLPLAASITATVCAVKRLA
ncbi:MAG: hypothetical protein ABJZ55_15190 [Fuerstiella sp.]